MVPLTEQQASVLKQGDPVRIAAPELGGELVVILAIDRESTESVLRRDLEDLREQAAWSQVALQAASSRMSDSAPN